MEKVSDGYVSNYTCYRIINIIKTTLQNLWNRYVNIETILLPGQNRGNAAIVEEEKFTENLPLLFDITRADAKKHLREEAFFF